VDEQDEYRRIFALVAMHGLLAHGADLDAEDNPFDVIPSAAVRYADALLDELNEVPAPSGGPVASPPGSDSPPAVQDVSQGAASLHAGEDAAAQGAPPGDLALPPSANGR
jgi:hypothetical protein